MASHAELTPVPPQAAVRDETIAPSSPTSRMLNARPAVVAQRAAADKLTSARAPNRTGLPEKLKAGVEALSGVSLDDVRVHRNSPEPAQLQAHAFARGTDIHLAPGQDQHLPHEAWHIVQQKQGRVKATRQTQNAAINDDAGLEREADTMGERASITAPAVAVPATGGGSFPGVQLQADMRTRRTQKNNLRKARGQLAEAVAARGNAWANEDEIAAHDSAQHAGQHHLNRQVRLNTLIGDIDATSAGLTAHNLRDSNLLGVEKKAGRGDDAVAVQLRSTGAPVTQLYIDNAVAHYNSAAAKWAGAAAHATRFNNQLAAALNPLSLAIRQGPTVQTLQQNALAKGHKANTVVAGEAAEPHYWWAKTQPPIATGPGAGVGIDIVPYAFASGNAAPDRGQVEIKTASSVPSLKASIATSIAGGNTHGTIMAVFSGAVATVDALLGTTFNAAGATYTFAAAGAAPNENGLTSLEIECPDGTKKYGILKT